MTRRAAQRARARKASAQQALMVGRFMHAGHLADNPNRGKRHTPPATARVHSFTTAEREQIKSARRDYRPLTVRQVIDFDSIGRKRPAFVTDGYTV